MVKLDVLYIMSSIVTSVTSDKKRLRLKCTSFRISVGSSKGWSLLSSGFKDKVL